MRYKLEDSVGLWGLRCCALALDGEELTKLVDELSLELEYLDIQLNLLEEDSRGDFEVLSAMVDGCEHAMGQLGLE